MAYTYKNIRFYRCYLNEDGKHLDVDIGIENSRFPRPPSLAEINAVFGTDFSTITVGYSFYSLFFGEDEMTASPRLPDDGIDYMKQGLGGTGSMKVPPMLQSVKSYTSVLKESGIVIAPVIPNTATSLYRMFYHAAALRIPASIPAKVTSIQSMYEGCTNVTGEIVVRPSSISTRTNALKDTTKPIVLYGNKTLCDQIAATANNGNASWSAWYDPVPAVTNRGPNSHTTAADMTRMVRNGVLAVNTYAPGRMVYNQGDIVREDEWKALVEAAQTIDPTITLSTRYDNLNKIEAAFDTAL